MGLTSITSTDPNYTVSTEQYIDSQLDSANISTMNRRFLYVAMIVTIIEPFHMKEYWERSCTGTFIRSEFILTMASCVLMDKHDESDPYATTIFLRPTGLSLRALKIYVHPHFFDLEEEVSSAFNFAIILVQNTHLTIFPQLPQAFEPFASLRNTCTLGSYGTNERPTLRKFEMIEMNNTKLNILKCSEYFAGRFCVNFVKIMPCAGDMGSPMICGGTLIALYVPSMYRVTDQCFDRFMSEFSYVFSALDWIYSVVDEPSPKLDWLGDPFYVLLLCTCTFCTMGAIYYGVIKITESCPDSFLVTTSMEEHPSVDSEDKAKDKRNTLETLRDLGVFVK